MGSKKHTLVSIRWQRPFISTWIFLRDHKHLVRFRAIFPSSHYVLLAILFLIGLELITVFHSWIWLFTGILLALMIYGVALVRIEEKGRFQPTQTILPIMTAAGLTGFTLFIPLTPLIHLYFAVAALLFYWLLRHGARLAYPTWNWLISSIVLFLNMAVILGIRFHLYLSVLPTLIIVFCITWLVSVQALRRVAASMTHAMLLASAIALVLTQITWTLQFLPLHYLVQAGVVIVVHYVLFHLVSLSLEHQLRRRHVAEYVILGIVSLLVLFSTARWI